jgi:hypothetical protein
VVLFSLDLSCLVVGRGGAIQFLGAPWEHGKGAACIPSMRRAGIAKDQAWEGATNTAATYGVWTDYSRSPAGSSGSDR